MPPTLAPFRGLRYNPQKISDLSQVVAPPYDVIDEKLRNQLYERNPYNVIRLILTKDEDGAGQGLTKYEAAKKYLEGWKKKEVLIRDASPRLYLYHQTYRLEDGRELTRKGFIALRRIESFEEGRIRPHEYTFAGPKADRLNLIKTTETNLSPIFGVFSDPARVTETLFQPALKQKPLFDIVTDDGNRHRLWGVDDAKVFAELDQLIAKRVVFIADGHHRYETALNYRNLRRSAVESKNGTPPPPAGGGRGAGEIDAPYNYVMMYLCPMEDEGLVILPTHRVVTVPLSSSWAEIKGRLQKFFDVTEFPRSEEKKALAQLQDGFKKGIAFLISTRDSLAVIFTDPQRVEKIPELSKLPKPVRELDVVILHQYLLPKAFQMDVAEDHDSVKVQYFKDTQEALRAPATGKAHLSFILNPTKISQVEAVSEIGERMPHKSTFFYPKLLSGLVFNPLN